MSKKKFRYSSILLLIAVCLSAGFLTGFKTENRNFKITKNLDIFNSLFKELDLFYVDTIDVEKSITAGIQNMLSTLDPYTKYYPASDREQITYITTGEYGGMGAVIMQRGDSGVYISEPYENTPAQKAGLKAGDKLIKIDDIDLTGKDSEQVSALLKGATNTHFRLTVEREGEPAPLVKEITRSKIAFPNVPYYGLERDSIGYIYLSGFTQGAAKEMKKAVTELTKNPKVKSLVLDMRNNPGGIMEEAVEIVNFFVPKDKVVLTTRGRLKQWDKTYKTTQHPIAEDIPLAVLIDGESASAAEIVAGALQDLDRAVIIGERSYGKGLVQTTRNLPYDGTMKITIARYYIPSGRSIQKIDYRQKNEDGSLGRAIADSLTSAFKTANGREVRDGGGVTPDFIVKKDRPANICYYLFIDNLIFDFANRYERTHGSIPPVPQFSLTDTDYDAFKQFVKSRNFTYDKQSANLLASLKEVAEFEGYSADTAEEFKALEAKLTHNLDRDLEFFKPEIKSLLQAEIARRYYYQKGNIIESLKTDKDLDKAVLVLGDKPLYSKTLNITPNKK